MSDLHVQLSSLSVLWRRLGWARTAQLVARVTHQQLRREPFGALPPVADWRERDSRAQAGDAVCLYRALLVVCPEDALSVASEAIEAGGVRFLQRTVGPLKQATLAGLSEPERRAFLETRGARFPNAVPRWTRTGGDAVSFEIDACRLVSLVAEVGHPELGRLFCLSDARFFGEVEPDVVLERPHTLANGDPRCVFHLRWRT